MWTIRQTNGSLSLSDPDAVVRLFSFFQAALPRAIVSRGTRRGSIELRAGNVTKNKRKKNAGSDVLFLLVNWRYELNFVGKRVLK